MTERSTSNTKGAMTDQLTFRPATHISAPASASASAQFAVKRGTLSFVTFLSAVLAIACVALAPATAQDQNQAGISGQGASASAQMASSVASTPTAPTLYAALPDDPSASLGPEAVPASASDSSSLEFPGFGGAPKPTTRRQERASSLHMKYIPAGWSVVHPLPAKDKVLLGVKDLYDPLNFAAMILSAGYEQVLNGQPNYGVDRGAFGERLGAAAIRESTQGVFTDAVFSPLFHEDPRYYVEGPDYSFVHRTLYAITRPLITRADSGKTSINGALLVGYAASSALSYTYYPQINKNFHDTASTFGGAIGGAALGFAVSEFSTDILQKLHFIKQP